MTKFWSVRLVEELDKADSASVLLAFGGNVKRRCNLSVTLRCFFMVSLCIFRNTNLAFSDPQTHTSEAKGTEKGGEEEDKEQEVKRYFKKKRKTRKVGRDGRDLFVCLFANCQTLLPAHTIQNMVATTLLAQNVYAK